MKIQMHSNAGAVAQELRHTGERVVENARKVMHRAAARIVKGAKLRAPVDEHNLEESIHIEKTYGERGRLQIDVVAGGFVNGRDVDEYAVIMHESDYKLGKGSQAKQDANPGVQVGSKFLERAAEVEEEVLDRVMIAAVRGASK